ncbi:PspC domain-containing protein [uncultured Endozoicomonas sp.]|uniref:PspC domain-containing protein n=1 Tax=uncultured Endozoicomonas sp. TaxID=432652 RepID=UPI00263561EA|nr:PspC domain-containing protein [uncultured Endozoicomonas sp.]
MSRLKKIFTQQKEGEASPAIMGVCSYIANRFHLDVLAVRLSAAGIAYFTSTSRAMLAYIAIGVVLSISTSGATNKKLRTKKTKIGSDNGPVKEEENSDFKEHESNPKLTKMAVKQLSRKLSQQEYRVAQLENCVTSNHLKVAREFRDLHASSKQQA